MLPENGEKKKKRIVVTQNPMKNATNPELETIYGSLEDHKHCKGWVKGTLGTEGGELSHY